MKPTVSTYIIQTLRNFKQTLENHEIREMVQSIYPKTSSATVDCTLSRLSKKMLINKLRTHEHGRSKFLYSASRPISVSKLILRELKGLKPKDSAEIHSIVLKGRPNSSRSTTDSTLFNLVGRGKLKKSKTDMTDKNVISGSSKYVYALND